MVAAIDGKSCSFNQIGTVTGENIDRKLVWHLTNHSCWNGKPVEDGDILPGEYWPIESNGCTYVPTQFDRGYTNDDICFQLDGVWQVALPCGWEEVGSIAEARRYMFKHACWVCNVIKPDFSYDSVEDNL